MREVLRRLSLTLPVRGRAELDRALRLRFTMAPVDRQS